MTSDNLTPTSEPSTELRPYRGAIEIAYPPAVREWVKREVNPLASAERVIQAIRERWPNLSRYPHPDTIRAWRESARHERDSLRREVYARMWREQGRSIIPAAIVGVATAQSEADAVLRRAVLRAERLHLVYQENPSERSLVAVERADRLVIQALAALRDTGYQLLTLTGAETSSAAAEPELIREDFVKQLMTSGEFTTREQAEVAFDTLAASLIPSTFEECDTSLRRHSE